MTKVQSANGAVNLILADGAKLTVNSEDKSAAGIKVSGEGNKFFHKGQLIIRSGNKKYNALGF